MRTLKDSLPIASLECPRVEVEFVFTELAKLKKAEATKRKLHWVMLCYFKYLEKKYSTLELPPIHIEQEWSPYTFMEFSNYLIERKYASFTVSTTLHRFRHALQFAIANRLINHNIIFSKIPSPVAETENYESYSKDQERKVDEVFEIEKESVIKNVNESQYQRKHCGLDPRIKREKRFGNPWRVFENQIWYFENVMQCVPVTNVKVFKRQHKYLYEFLGCSLSAFYSKLGINLSPTKEIVCLFALSIARITGLNSSSLFGLEIDCIKTEPKGGLALLRYYKERSTGDKVLTSDVLGREVFERLRKEVNFLLDLTQPHRSYLNREMKNKLFLIKGRRDFRILSNKDLTQVSTELKKKYKLDFSIIIPRLRSTSLNNSMIQESDVTRTMELGGHEDYRTTFGYGSKQRIESRALIEINLVLSRRFLTGLNIAPEKCYKTQLAYCTNPFEPPYSKAKLPCTLVHKCMSCSNFRFSIKDLPKMISYLFSIIGSKEYQFKKLPNQEDYESTVKLIEGIIVDNNLKITSDELQKSVQQAITMNFLVDPIVI